MHACIDRIKELLPVWKREVTSSGEAWVEGSSVAGENALSVAAFTDRHDGTMTSNSVKFAR